MAKNQRSALDKAHRVRRLRRKLFELRSLLQVTRDLAAALDEETVLTQFLRSTISMVHSESAALFRYDGPTGRLRLVDERNLPGSSRPTAVLSADEVSFLEGPEAREGVAVGSSDLSPEARDFTRGQGAWLAAWEAEAIVPLVARGGLWGLAVFGPRLLGRAYRAAHLGLLAAASQTAATALETLALGSRERSRPEPSRVTTPAPAPVPSVSEPPAVEDLAQLRARFPALSEIVGESPALSGALFELAKVAPTRFPVLVLGPTGTGKELAARAIHRMSPRADGPFEVVDCGAIPGELIESELFGHVRGAFTGATRDRRGAFELAHGGTLFLDEIGELPAIAQTRLLRILQEGQLRRVGDERTVHVNVRVVAATNKDLPRFIEDGRFRPDLYYRLSVFTVRLPALSERRTDLPLLCKHILGRLAAETGHSEPRLSQAILRRLTEHEFPGNVRELQNILSVLLLKSGPEGPRPEDLEAAMAQSGGNRGERPRLPDQDDEEAEGLPSRGDAEATGRWVLEQLRKCDFNVSQAERALDRLQRSAAGRNAAPVADRASLTYYMQGECFRAFAETGFNFEASARTVAKMPDLVPAVRARMQRFLGFVAEVARPFPGEDEARRACRERLPKLPAHYIPFLDAIASGFARGEWVPEPVAPGPGR